MTIMQGDSYRIYINLTQNGKILTPEMIAEVEVYVGAGLRKLFSQGGVMFDKNTKRWYIHPSQEETLALQADTTYDVLVRIRYNEKEPAEVVGLNVGRITVTDSISEAVI